MGCFKKKEADPNEETSRKPSDSPFKQQKMKAWQPVLTASTVLPLFFLVGAVFLPIGIALLVSSNNIKEVVVEYSELPDCKKCVKADILAEKCNCTAYFSLSTSWNEDIYFYYGLSNFYQNHRRYVRSRDDNQLNGKLSNSPSSNCAPFDKVNNTAIVPCGAIANSLFNDEFHLKLAANNDGYVPWTDEGIAWKSDRDVKFQNPSNFSEFDKYHKPLAWSKPISALKDGLRNNDFIVWMRVAAFPTFRKLYRKFKKGVAGTYREGLPSGKYQLDIKYRYPVKEFGGKKRFIITTSSWMGGKNPFLGTCYVVVGSLCLVFGVIFLLIHMKRTKSAGK